MRFQIPQLAPLLAAPTRKTGEFVINVLAVLNRVVQAAQLVNGPCAAELLLRNPQPRELLLKFFVSENLTRVGLATGNPNSRSPV